MKRSRRDKNHAKRNRRGIEAFEHLKLEDFVKGLDFLRAKMREDKYYI